MADRTSAGIFGKQFERIAKGKITDKKRKEARELWVDTWEYDFNPYQMGCDAALIKLGLAEDRGEDGVRYKCSDGIAWEDD